jgi:hypothetical protein
MSATMNTSYSNAQMLNENLIWYLT